jgi:hypothetical protein
MSKDRDQFNKDRNQDQNQNRPTGSNRDFDNENRLKKDYNNPKDRENRDKEGR